MELNVYIRACYGDHLSDMACYRHLAGSLVYLDTRTDIFYHAHILTKFIYVPMMVHYSPLLCVLRYHRDTISHHLFFPCSKSL
jgi:hypothetical protein